MGRPGGGEEEVTKKMKEKNNGECFLICGGTIGHSPLQGHCPKDNIGEVEREEQEEGNS